MIEDRRDCEFIPFNGILRERGIFRHPLLSSSASRLMAQHTIIRNTPMSIRRLTHSHANSDRDRRANLLMLLTRAWIGDRAPRAAARMPLSSQR
jgi:hypothetical protein